MTRPVEAIRDILEAQGLLRQNVKLLCAVSGGADSVALLRGLYLLRREYAFSLRVLHVQHGLRGEESLRDEVFVRQLCADWNIPLTVRNADLQGTMATPGIETIARNGRLRIFTEEGIEADALLLAHHRDDQAETVLMHLLRGAGSDGLSGMAPVSTVNGLTVLRPFLSISKEELLQWLDFQGIAHCEDSSNADASNPRNRLRLQWMPQLEQLAPGFGGRIAQSAEILRTETVWMNEAAEALYNSAFVNCPPLYALKLIPLQNAPTALLRRLLRLWMQKAYPLIGHTEGEMGLSYEDTLTLCEFATDAARGSLNLPLGLKAVKGRFLLSLLWQDGTPLFPFEKKEASLSSPCDCCIMDTRFHTAACEGDSVPNTPFWVCLPQDCFDAVLRSPQPGDSFHPFGAPGSKPLRRYFTDIHLDAPLRTCWPVLAQGSEVLWIPGLASSQKLRMDGAAVRSLRVELGKGLLSDLIKE